MKDVERSREQRSLKAFGSGVRKADYLFQLTLSSPKFFENED